MHQHLFNPLVRNAGPPISGRSLTRLSNPLMHNNPNSKTAKEGKQVQNISIWGGDDRHVETRALDSGGPKFHELSFTHGDTPAGRPPRQAMHSQVSGPIRGDEPKETKHQSKHRHMLSKFDQDPELGGDSRENIKIEHGEGHIEGESQHQEVKNQNDQRTHPNSSSEDPRCRDIRETNDHAVYDHAFRSHDGCRSYRGEAERDGVGELADTRMGSKEKQKYNDNHVRSNHDVESHDIVTHDASRCCRRKSERPKVNVRSQERKQKMQESKYPWTTPRVLARYLALRMKTDEPTVWSIDGYDGLESWGGRKTRAANGV